MYQYDIYIKIILKKWKNKPSSMGFVYYSHKKIKWLSNIYMQRRMLIAW
jgi:hypothetical protein